MLRNSGVMDEKPEEEARRRRRKPMTPELRRFLGGARSLHDQPQAEEEEAEEGESPEIEEPTAAELEPEFEEEEERPTPRSLRQKLPEEEPAPRTTRSTVSLAPSHQLSRVSQMQTVALIIGGFVLLVGVFYVGKKFEYWKYLIMSANKPKLTDTSPDKFPGLSAEDLVEQGLAAERLGEWPAAVERYLSAKRKNLGYRGILFRVGKLQYDHANFDLADKILENAIALGEDVAAANYLRGMIATGRNNLQAAEGFFEAAANAEPFSAVHYYNWADALRRDHHPKEAIAIYERGATRVSGEQDRNVYQFKARMSMIEAGDAASLSEEVEKKQTARALSVEWLMTAAALKIREGNIPDAVQLIDKARTANAVGLYSQFASCANDMFFASASEKYPEIAKACGVPSASGIGSP